MLNTICNSLLVSLTTFAPLIFASERSASIPFEPLKIFLKSGQEGGGKDHIIFNMTSDTEWKKLEKEIIGGDHLLSKIDFKKYQIFGVQEFVRSGGHSISVESIESISKKGKPRSFMARIKRIEPGRNCITTDGMEAPQSFVLIPAKFKFSHVEFIKERSPDCKPD
jgi:hypothetical protein